MKKLSPAIIFSILFGVVSLLLFIRLSKVQNSSNLYKAENKHFVLGVVDTIKSEVLSELRIINVYLPEGYSRDSPETYPVIYLLDGSAKEYFIQVVGLVHYFNLPWINRFPKSIVVGIANINRNRDFTFQTSNTDFYSLAGFNKKDFPVTGGSEKFISFIESELQPFIENKYRTNCSKTIIGQSLGGLLATEVLLKKSILFNTYLILSPSLWWDKESLLKSAPDLIKAQPNRQIKVYVGVSNEGEMMINDAKSLASILKNKGSDHIQIIYDYIPCENHTTMIHQAVYNGFKSLYPIE